MLALIAESYLQHGPASQSSADRYQTVVHVDAMTLKRGNDGRCEIEQGLTIPIETARRLLCDSSADGGETKLSILFTLYRAHHRNVHKGEIVIKGGPHGGWQFLYDAAAHITGV